MPPAIAISIGISFALTAAQYAYQRFTQKPIGVGDRNFQVNTASTRKYVPVIYGRAKVGIDVVFHDTNPASAKDYWIVGSICVGEIEAIDRIWFDDRLVVDYENNTGILPPYAGRVSFARYLGTDDQTANSSLINIFPDKWNANHRGSGIAYIVANLIMDLDVFPNGVPNITVSIRGKKVRDPRDSNYPSDTPAYNNNPSLCILDYLVGGRDANNNIRYGLGALTSEINLDYFRAEANFADELLRVPLGAPPAPFPKLVNATGNLGVGNYRYLCVYRASSGEHTGAGSKSKKIKTTNNKKQIKLTEIQPSGSPEVAYIDIYRTAVNDSVFKLAGTIDNVLTDGYLEFNDNVADASLGAEAPSDNNMYNIHPTQKRFTCDGLVDCERDIKTNLEDLLTACRGNLVFESGLYALFTKKATVPEVFELTEHNITGNWEFKAPGVTPMTNLIKVSFPNKSNKWETDYVFWPLDRRTNRYLAEDADFDNSKTIDLFYTVDKQRSRQIGQIVRKESRQGILASCTVFEEAMKLRYGCVVNVTHSTPGWTKKPFWVDSIGVYPTGQLQISLSEYDATVYDEETIAVDTVGADDTDLPDPFELPDEVTDVTITEELYTDKTITNWRLKVTYTNPTSPLWDHSDIYVEAGPAAEFEYYTRIDRSSQGVFYIYPVEANMTYNIIILSVSTLGVKNDINDPDNTVWQHTVTPPTPPTPTGLQIRNRGNETNVYGKEFVFVWPKVSAYGDGTANSEYAQAQTEFAQENIRYIIEIRFSGIADNIEVGRTRRKAKNIVAHSKIVSHNRYAYTLEQNIEDTKTMWEGHDYDDNYDEYYGIPQRTITARLWAINAWNVKSQGYAEITVTNQAPDMEDRLGVPIIPTAYREKSSLEFTFPHPGKEYDISRFIGILALDSGLSTQIASKTIASAVTVFDTDEDLNGVEYEMKFRSLDPKVTYYFAVIPVDVYGKGTRSQIISNQPALTHDDANTKITPPPKILSVTTEVLKNNAGKLRWALANVGDIKQYIVDWRGVENTGATQPPSDDEVAQGYLDSDTNKKVLGGHLNIPGDKAYAIVKGLKAGFKYFARVRGENTSEQLGTWSDWATHTASVSSDPAVLEDGSVTESKLANLAVTASKLANAAATAVKQKLDGIVTILHNEGGGFDWKDNNGYRRLAIRAINNGVPLIGFAKATYDAVSDIDDLNKMLFTSKAKGYLSYVDSGSTSITFDEATNTPTDTELSQDESISLNISENIVRGVLAFANFTLGGRDYMVPLGGFQDFVTSGKRLQFFLAYDSTDTTHLLKVRRWINNASGENWTVPELTLKINWYVLGETLLKQ